MSEFLRPRLVGPRFDEGKIPLEMLGDLSVLREMVIEVAKSRYLEGNPHRKRSPRGFTGGISLALTGIEKGSATPVIDAEFHPPQVLGVPQLPGMPGIFDQYFVEARDAIIDAIAAAETDSLTAEHLPENCLEYFDRIGRRLREEESIEFTSPARTNPARLTKASRRRLVLASQMTEMTEVVRLVGRFQRRTKTDCLLRFYCWEGGKSPQRCNTHTRTLYWRSLTATWMIARH